jgi:MFS family permease
MDQNIVATAIPHITNEFHSLGDVGWYSSACLFALYLCQLVWSRVYVYFSIKMTFIIALGIFEVGSIVCATAPSSVALIGGRAIAGWGGAGCVAGFGIILTRTVPLHLRMLYDSAFNALYGVAAVTAPVLGGAFTTKLTWRWCFWINLPFGGLTGLLVIVFLETTQGHDLHELHLKEKWRLFDMIGLAVLTPAILCLLLALQWGGMRYAWDSGTVIGLFVAFAVLFCVYIVIQTRKKELALTPPHIVGQRSIASSIWYMFSGGMAVTVLEYYVSTVIHPLRSGG